MKLTIFILGAILVCLNGCSEPTYPGSYSNQVVVQGYLMANQPIDSIIVRRTARLEEYVSSTALALSGSLVVVTGNGVADTLREMTGYAGYYTSLRVPQNIIKPKQTYALYVRTQDGRVVTATTTVPDTFRIIGKENFPRALRYRQGLYTISWTPSATSSDYITAITSVDLSIIEPIPRDFGNRDTSENKPERTSYGFNFVESTHTEIPWFAFNYYGENALIVEAIDKNYYDFVRQINGGGTDIREIRYSVSGGIGVFGSAALDSLHVILLP